jgi:crotonobetainyl-CoA:carnitine CoA-transferase CaiB-like acyl-CoA transferase
MHLKALHEIKPLAGLKVLSLAVNLPGPVAAARLRDLGAAVTKIEPPDGDPAERVCPAWYRALHENVTVLALDLRDAAQRSRLDAMLAESDLFLTSLRPAALDRLQLSWSDLHARFPRLCHVAIIGYPPPDENRPGHDLPYQAALGLLSPPQMPRALLADLGGAEEAAMAAVALLLARERGDEPGAAYVSLAEAAGRFAPAINHGLTATGGVLAGGRPDYNLYEAADGWIAVAALEPHFAERLAGELKLDVLSRDSLAIAFRGRRAREWEDWADARDLPLCAVRLGPMERQD